jgi:hypothetical protein
MRLYHGTNSKIETPKLIIPKRALDFGVGFYTTSDRNQAENWAKIVVKRKNNGVPMLNVYEFEPANFPFLQVKQFGKPTKEWLDFICEHRLENYKGKDFDLIIGSVANDDTIQVIHDYMRAKDKDLYAPIALSEIMPENLTDQYVFKTTLALSFLKLIEIKTI